MPKGRPPYKQVLGLKEWKEYTKEEQEEKIKKINNKYAQKLFHILSNAEKRKKKQEGLQNSLRNNDVNHQICTNQSNIETVGAILLFYKKNVVDQSFTPTEEEIKDLIFKNKSLLHTPGQWVLLEEGFTEEKNKEEQKNKIQAAINAEWMADYVKEIKNAFQIKTGNYPPKTRQNSVRSRLAVGNKKFFTLKKGKRFCTDHNNFDTAISIVNLYYEIQIENAKDEQEKGNFITQREEWEKQVAEVNALPTQHQQNKIKFEQNLLSASSAGSSSNSVVDSQIPTTISDLESDNDEPPPKRARTESNSTEQSDTNFSVNSMEKSSIAGASASNTELSDDELEAIGYVVRKKAEKKGDGRNANCPRHATINFECKYCVKFNIDNPNIKTEPIEQSEPEKTILHCAVHENFMNGCKKCIATQYQ